MIEISTYALEAAIQAVDEKIWALKTQMDETAGNGDDTSDLEDEIMGFMKAADSLRASHEKALELCYKITPYEKLLHEDGGETNG